MQTVPARLHVLLASNSPVGLVIRRGPSKQVVTLRWDRRTDEFTLGQWLKGRIYERRCDLSPDGKFFIYFAMNGKWRSEVRGSWTAVSRAPYLKAIALFPKGDCWNGGGLWSGNRTYWLNHYPDFEIMQNTNQVIHDPGYRSVVGGECLGVYYPRLIRDGWTLVQDGSNLAVFEKSAGSGWILRKLAHSECGKSGKGCYWDEHQLFHSKTGARVHKPNWEWADIDGERTVWAEGGKLHAGHTMAAGLTDEVVLFDFNDMRFEPIKAPY